jgi:hypothetical protein
MKLSLSILFLSLGVFFSSCCSKKTVPEEKITLKTTAIEHGKEILYLLKNKSIDTITRNGSLAYELKTNATTDVVQYIYEINMDQVQYDGGLREMLVFEIPHGDYELNLTDNELQNTKMLFGRQCYCRGQNGIFKITKGTLNISSKAGKIVVDLNFQQDKVPQITKSISFK